MVARAMVMVKVAIWIIPRWRCVPRWNHAIDIHGSRSGARLRRCVLNRENDFAGSTLALQRDQIVGGWNKRNAI